MLFCIMLCSPMAQAQTGPYKQQDTQATSAITQDVLIRVVPGVFATLGG